MTKIKGRTAFNNSGTACIPNPSGAPKTKFKGRGGVPEGGLKHFPGGAASIDNGNRRLAKSEMGDGAGSGTSFSGRTAFNRGRK